MNPSESYGGYGGVDNCTKYVPPQASDFIPQPSLKGPKVKYTPPSAPSFVPYPATVPFTNEYREKIKLLVDKNGPVMNVNNILIRTRTDSLTGVTDRTFAITSSASPQHLITYTMPASSVAIDLLRTDGGYF